MELGILTEAMAWCSKSSMVAMQILVHKLVARLQALACARSTFASAEINTYIAGAEMREQVTSTPQTDALKEQMRGCSRTKPYPRGTGSRV